jgi:hypothetical protein
MDAPTIFGELESAGRAGTVEAPEQITEGGRSEAAGKEHGE